MVSFSIVIATGGRESLAETLASITPHLLSGDEVLVERLDCEWGGRARNRAIPRCAGSHLLFIDDDDVYLPGALHRIRELVAEADEQVHLFAMRYTNGMEVHPSFPIGEGSVGTPMICVPNQEGKIGTWSDRYEQDFDFAYSTMAMRRDEPVLHDEFVALVRPRA